ncbi:MAG: hypothetical protein KAH56_01985 [Candidatus Krumholzibacteria bacterium]|nr:hypothetical protein [Candidatus Krumholzibacteria bacterium]
MGLFDTTIRFDDDRDVDVDMTSVSVSGGWFINDRWTVRASAGVILGGSLQPADGTVHDVEPGGTGTIGTEYRAVVGREATPFIDLSLFLSASWAQTVAPDSNNKTDYSAADARLGVRAGWNVEDSFFPYVVTRVFGGPVNWKLDGEDVVGSDINHYQVAFGASTRIGPVGLFVEGSFLGEKALSTGMSTTW